MIVLELYKTPLAFPEILHFYDLKNYKLIGNLLMSDEIMEKDLFRFAYVKRAFHLLTEFKDDNGLGRYIRDNPIEMPFFLSSKEYADIIWKNSNNPSVSSKGTRYSFRKIRIVKGNKTEESTLFMKDIDFDRFIPVQKYTLPIAIDSRVTRACINMTGTRSVILDPFCGTGTTLVQASSMDLFPIGFDNDYKMIKIARQNMENKHYILKLFDSTRIDFDIDYVFSDLPYGKNTRNIDGDLYKRFVKILNDRLIKRAVIVLPRMIEVDDAIAYYNLYVHRSLTRTIVVIDKRKS